MNTQIDHLTHEQISNLLIADAFNSDVCAHLKACAECNGELTTLRQSLASFREATTLYSASQPRRALLPARRFTGSVMLWAATAAATLAIGIAVPLNLHHAKPVAAVNIAAQHQRQQPVQTASVAQPVPTDEELVAGIEQDLSASIPSSMQPLEDPLPSTQTSTQASK